MARQAELAQLSAEEYLERTGMDGVMRELASLLLEHRPARPVAFLCEQYELPSLRILTQPNTSLMRSYHCIQQSGPRAFLDSLFAAYSALDAKRGGTNAGLRGAEYMALTRMLCVDFPAEVVTGVLGALGKKESDTVSFEEFVGGMQTVLLYRDFLEEAASVFHHLDTEHQGKVKVEALYRALAKLSARTDMRVPSMSQLEQSEAAALLQGKATVTYQDFLLAMFSAAT